MPTAGSRHRDEGETKQERPLWFSGRLSGSDVCLAMPHLKRGTRAQPRDLPPRDRSESLHSIPRKGEARRLPGRRRSKYGVGGCSILPSLGITPLAGSLHPVSTIPAAERIRIPRLDFYAHQREAIAAWQAGARLMIWLWHRGAGKGRGALALLALAAWQQPATYLFVSPTHRMAGETVWDAIDPHTGEPYLALID